MLGDRSLNKGAFLDVAHSSFFFLLSLPVALKSAVSGRKQFPAGELQLRIRELCYVCPTVVDRTFDGPIVSEYTVNLNRVPIMAIYIFTNLGLVVYFQQKTRSVRSKTLSQGTVMPVRQKDMLKTSKSPNL